MGKISSGIPSLDRLVDSLYIGDNVVWEVEAGTQHNVFIRKFIDRSFEETRKVIYVSFNSSPQTVLGKISSSFDPGHFVLVDCFTSGKGKNDPTFLKFYETPTQVHTIRVEKPRDIEAVTQSLNAIEEGLQTGVCYVFDSVTGMQDLWGNEEDTYHFFTYMCPRLYDLGTVAYWILEKDAHSQKFKANLRHITQVVFEVYRRRERLYIKALKLEGRPDREAFKPHLFEIHDGAVAISLPKKEVASDIGSRLRETRMKLGISQKELADKIDLTPSFLSQLENGQISPSLGSFLQICGALGVSPGQFFEGRQDAPLPWLIRRETVLSRPAALEQGVTLHEIVSDERSAVHLVAIPAGAVLDRHFFYRKSREFIYVLKGQLSATIDGKRERLHQGDCLLLKESFPSEWRNEGGENAEVLLMS